MGGVRTLQGLGWETAFLTQLACIPAGLQTRCSWSHVSTDTSRRPREQALRCTQTQHTEDFLSPSLKGLCLCVCVCVQLKDSGPSFRTLPLILPSPTAAP